MKFSSDFDEILEKLLQTEEFEFCSDLDGIIGKRVQNEEVVKIKGEEDNVPVCCFFGMRPVFRRIRIEGSWIRQDAIFELRRSAETIYGIVAFPKREEDKD